MSPRDGEVKADIDTDVATGVTTDENGNFVFDASLMDESLHGEEISFTVNDEETTCRITVYGDVELTVTTDVSYDEMRTVATVTYEVSNRYPDLTYSWDFGNGEAYDELPNENRTIEKTYELSLLDFNTIEPSLFVTNGLCGKEIPIDPITFEERVDVNLDIIDNFCVNVNSDQEVSIPFTEKNPPEAQIEVVGGDLPGLLVGDNEIFINPIEFQSFNTPIAFTLGGQQTNAQITIGFTFDVEIEVINRDYNWVNNELHFRYVLKAIIPGNIDPGSMNYRWIAGGEEQDENQSELELNLPVNREGRFTNVSVEITSVGPCTSEQSVSLGEPYPDFRLSMPDEELIYCLKDPDSHPITVDPDIDGTPVEGDGVSFDEEGNPQFSVIDRSSPSIGTVDLSIDGDTLLTLTIKDIPVVDFEAAIDGDTLVLTNNSSEDADSYEWNVGNIDITRTVKQNEVIPLDRFNNDFINITLRVFNKCGDKKRTLPEFRIPKETQENKCTDVVLAGMGAERKKLPKSTDIDSNDLIEVRTVGFYDSVLLATPEIQNTILTSGAITDDITVKLTETYTRTQQEIQENVNNFKRVEELSSYLISQTKYFFLLMHCQPDGTYEGNKDKMDAIFRSLATNFAQLKGAGFDIDKEGVLNNFLNNYINDPEVESFIKSDIQSKLLPAI